MQTVTSSSIVGQPTPGYINLALSTVCIAVEEGFLACAAIRPRRLVALGLESGQSGYEFPWRAKAGVTDRQNATWIALAQHRRGTDPRSFTLALQRRAEGSAGEDPGDQRAFQGIAKVLDQRNLSFMSHVSGRAEARDPSGSDLRMDAGRSPLGA